MLDIVLTTIVMLVVPAALIALKWYFLEYRPLKKWEEMSEEDALVEVLEWSRGKVIDKWMGVTAILYTSPGLDKNEVITDLSRLESDGIVGLSVWGEEEELSVSTSPMNLYRFKDGSFVCI